MKNREIKPQKTCTTGETNHRKRERRSGWMEHSRKSRVDFVGRGDPRERLEGLNLLAEENRSSLVALGDKRSRVEPSLSCIDIKKFTDWGIDLTFGSTLVSYLETGGTRNNIRVLDRVTTSYYVWPVYLVPLSSREFSFTVLRKPSTSTRKKTEGILVVVVGEIVYYYTQTGTLFTKTYLNEEIRSVVETFSPGHNVCSLYFVPKNPDLYGHLVSWLVKRVGTLDIQDFLTLPSICKLLRNPPEILLILYRLYCRKKTGLKTKNIHTPISSPLPFFLD